MASKIKYLVINVTKDIQDLYTENDKILLKEIKEDINKWNVHELEYNISKMAMLPNLSTDLNLIPSKVLCLFL